jgi:hypothetical protein
MKKLAVHKAGHGPYPGKYQGPVIDFIKAAKELEEEEAGNASGMSDKPGMDWD